MTFPILLSLLVLSSSGEYRLDDYIVDDVCSPSSCKCDISPAIDFILDHCAKHPPYKDAYDKVGCDIYIPPGCFYQSKTIVLDRNHKLYGSGGWGQSARTLIYVKAGITAVRIAQGGSRSQVEDIAFNALGTSTSTIPWYGVEMKFRGALDGIWARGFVQGLRIDAGALREDDPSNSNGFWVTRSRFDNNQHAGAFVDGPDVNAGYIGLPDTTGNCLQASKWAVQLGACAGITDSSFLGITIIAPHAAANVERDGFQYPAYITEGDSNHTIIIGPYSERGQATSILARNTIAIGGLSTWAGLGLRVDGTMFSGATFRNDKDPKNIVELNLGRVAASGTFLEFKSYGIDQSRPLRWKADVGKKQYFLDIANQLRLQFYGQDGSTWFRVPGTVTP